MRESRYLNYKKKNNFMNLVITVVVIILVFIIILGLFLNLVNQSSLTKVKDDLKIKDYIINKYDISDDITFFDVYYGDSVYYLMQTRIETIVLNQSLNIEKRYLNEDVVSQAKLLEVYNKEYTDINLGYESDSETLIYEIKTIRKNNVEYVYYDATNLKFLKSFVLEEK